jgi:hypothetical protein
MLILMISLGKASQGRRREGRKEKRRRRERSFVLIIVARSRPAD